MHVLVTGARGRLGASVTDVLRAAGHRVSAVDRTPGDDPDDLTVDLLDTAAVHALLDRRRPDAVVHLAAIAVPFSAPEREILMTNTALAFDVLQASVAAGATRILAASSPTVVGYGGPGWRPETLPLDESAPSAPSNAYALSKTYVEDAVAMLARSTPDVRFASFRPCYVISPAEWDGAPTQQGHTVVERLRRPELAAVSLFNYVDARDAAAFVESWLSADSAPSGARYFVGAADALATEPLRDLIPRWHPGAASAAVGLSGTAPAFDVSAAMRDTGWRPRRSWRTELDAESLASLAQPVERAGA
ncbi:NAD-dependent epimerase/dehydratase family protein [Microbacterium marinilacus]|uniref:NAD(P)-dependent oxidoreductase n=1 Tax=Microbacterium marinilacus TaxID=415209 RepID=A0ABP7BJY7_9MICO|nr:NAD(P)-dependent oxidoreductase [Microbacterium marinilacus]MBY0687669.1 NAD(P)-dependent oxidoreductase [Microbacterium marinilacus]